MVHNVALACIHHDPDSRLLRQTERVLPALRQMVAIIGIRATDVTPDAALAPLLQANIPVTRDPSEGHARLGRARRQALGMGHATDAPHILFCDWDRALHWAEYYPAELAAVATQLTAYDFTVLGRTQRAFDSHPRPQRDTEAIVNHVFAQVSGKPWDVTAAARGVSARAAHGIIADCRDETIGTDVSWPLFIQRETPYTLGMIATEGLEFETADRFPEEIAAAGGLDAWLARIDADPREWMLRLEIARLEVAAAFAPQE